MPAVKAGLHSAYNGLMKNNQRNLKIFAGLAALVFCVFMAANVAEFAARKKYAASSFVFTDADKVNISSEYARYSFTAVDYTDNIGFFRQAPRGHVYAVVTYEMRTTMQVPNLSPKERILLRSPHGNTYAPDQSATASCDAFSYVPHDWYIYEIHANGESFQLMPKKMYIGYAVYLRPLPVESNRPSFVCVPQTVKD